MKRILLKPSVLWCIVGLLVGLSTSCIHRVTRPLTPAELARRQWGRQILKEIEEHDVLEVEEPDECVYRYYLVSEAKRDERGELTVAHVRKGPYDSDEFVSPQMAIKTNKRYSVDNADEWRTGMLLWLNSKARPVRPYAPSKCLLGSQHS